MVGTGTCQCHKVLRSPTKEYQHCQNEALASLSGIEVIADNILCYGSGETVKGALKEHDSNLLTLLDCARSMNLKLNKKRFRLRLDQVTYIPGRDMLTMAFGGIWPFVHI